MIGETSYLEIESLTRELCSDDLDFRQQAILIQEIFNTNVNKLDEIPKKWLILMSTLEKLNLNIDKRKLYISNFISESKKKILEIEKIFNQQFDKEFCKYKSQVRNYKNFVISKGGKIKNISPSVRYYMDIDKVDSLKIYFNENVIKTRINISEAEKLLIYISSPKSYNHSLSAKKDEGNNPSSKISMSDQDKIVQFELGNKFDNHRKQLRDCHKK